MIKISNTPKDTYEIIKILLSEKFIEVTDPRLWYKDEAIKNLKLHFILFNINTDLDGLTPDIYIINSRYLKLFKS